MIMVVTGQIMPDISVISIGREEVEHQVNAQASTHAVLVKVHHAAQDLVCEPLLFDGC